MKICKNEIKKKQLETLPGYFIFDPSESFIKVNIGILLYFVDFH